MNKYNEIKQIFIKSFRNSEIDNNWNEIQSELNKIEYIDDHYSSDLDYIDVVLYFMLGELDKIKDINIIQVFNIINNHIKYIKMFKQSNNINKYEYLLEHNSIMDIIVLYSKLNDNSVHNIFKQIIIKYIQKNINLDETISTLNKYLIKNEIDGVKFFIFMTKYLNDNEILKLILIMLKKENNKIFNNTLIVGWYINILYKINNENIIIISSWINNENVFKHIQEYLTIIINENINKIILVSAEYLKFDKYLSKEYIKYYLLNSEELDFDYKFYNSYIPIKNILNKSELHKIIKEFYTPNLINSEFIFNNISPKLDNAGFYNILMKCYNLFNYLGDIELFWRLIRMLISDVGNIGSIVRVLNKIKNIPIRMKLNIAIGIFSNINYIISASYNTNIIEFIDNSIISEPKIMEYLLNNNYINDMIFYVDISKYLMNYISNLSDEDLNLFYGRFFERLRIDKSSIDNIIEVIKYINDNLEKFEKWLDKNKSYIKPNVILKLKSLYADENIQLFFMLLEDYDIFKNVIKTITSDLYGEEVSDSDLTEFLSSKILVRLSTLERRKYKDKKIVEYQNNKLGERLPNVIYIDTISEQYHKKSNDIEIKTLSILLNYLKNNNKIYLNQDEIEMFDKQFYSDIYKTSHSDSFSDLNYFLNCYSQISNLIHTNMDIRETSYKTNYSNQSLNYGEHRLLRFDMKNSEDINNIFKQYSNIFKEDFIRQLDIEYKKRTMTHPTSSADYTIGWIRFHVDEKTSTIFIDESQTDISKNIGLGILLDIFSSSGEMLKGVMMKRNIEQLSRYFPDGKKTYNMMNTNKKFKSDIVKMANSMSNFILLNQMKIFQHFVIKKYPNYTIILPSADLRQNLLGGSPSLAGYDSISNVLNFKSKMFSETQLYQDLKTSKSLRVVPDGKIFIWSYLTEMLRGFNI